MLVNNNSALQALASLYANDSAKGARRTKAAEDVPSFKDELFISKEAQSFSDMLSELRSMDEVRTDRVEALSRQMAGGMYEVNAENVAASMLDGLRF